jgi:hypothetical protein
MSITAKIDDGDVMRFLRRVEKAVPAARKIAAVYAQRCVKDHFAALNKERHREAAGMHQFYANASRSTKGSVIGEDVVVSISQQGISLRRFGGTVTPKRSKYLALPDKDNATAISKNPRSVPGLHFRRNAAGNGGRLTDSTGRVFYWLVKKTVHQPDPSVLPTDKALSDAIIPPMQRYVENL